MIPLEKALVERLRGRPFALLGINSDSYRDKLKSLTVEKGITWRSWWDRGRTGGPIATRWDVQRWPTIIVLDLLISFLMAATSSRRACRSAPRG